jgi:outer membrane protein assembly factor BamB
MHPLLTPLVALATLSALAPPANWPQFRGPSASGIAPGAPPPLTWDIDSGRNIRWKTPIPGLGHASPVIWGDRVYVTTAISGREKDDLVVGLYGDIAPVDDATAHSWKVYCLDRTTGKVLWERTAKQGAPRIKRHPKSTQANPTPATDGRFVVAFFGSEGLYCYDTAGTLRWKKDFGVLDSGYYEVPDAQWGFASSPVIWENKVLVQCDVQKGSFLAALDLKTGKELWRTPRQDVPTWSTPTVTVVEGRAQVVVNGLRQIGGYDVATGKSLWQLTGGGDIPVPTPVVGKGLIFITNAHGRMAPIYAIRPGAQGDITPPRPDTLTRYLAWSTERSGAYMQTPLVVGDYLYVCRDNGVLSCYEATTGQRVYEERLGTGRTGFTASAVACAGRLYFTSEEGQIFVVRAGPRFQVLGSSQMGETCMATPAISDSTLFVRTRGHIVAIGPKTPAR